MKVEITAPLELTDTQASLLDMHSFLNTMNVLMGSLQIIEMLVERPNALADATAICESITDRLADRDTAIDTARQIEDYRTAILAALDRVRQDGLVADSIAEDFDRLVENVVNVFGILRVRTQEILARLAHPGQWALFKTEMLENNLVAFLNAVAKNSHGRYGIVFDAAGQGPGDYLAELNIQSVDGPAITMPPILQDVMRDLIANARKYTTPGKRLSLSLIDDGAALTLVVSDQGSGIPPEEMAKVVHFGYRAGNVADKLTCGGGFGLTKAYDVACRFSGRMWIESELDAGTRITIAIPRPDAEG